MDQEGYVASEWPSLVGIGGLNSVNAVTLSAGNKNGIWNVKILL